MTAVGRRVTDMQEICQRIASLVGSIRDDASTGLQRLRLVDDPISETPALQTGPAVATCGQSRRPVGLTRIARSLTTMGLLGAVACHSALAQDAGSLSGQAPAPTPPPRRILGCAVEPPAGTSANCCTGCSAFSAGPGFSAGRRPVRLQQHARLARRRSGCTCCRSICHTGASAGASARACRSTRSPRPKPEHDQRACQPR